MPVYHSQFNELPADFCKTNMFPIKTKVKGPAAKLTGDGEDIIDEAIKFFRANVLFRKYETEGPGDLMICYLTVYISEVLRHLAQKKTKNDGASHVTSLSMKPNFSIPGDSGFPLGGFFETPKDRNQGEKMRGYMRQLREETAMRLVERIYNEDGTQNKWWFQFAKRKFMNISST